MGLARTARLALAAGMVAILAGCGNTARQPGDITEERLLSAENDPDNWLGHGRTYAEQRFSPLSDINDGNISQLSLAWAVELDTNRGQEATPIVVDGIMYVSIAWSKVMAVDAASGEVLWTHNPNVDGRKAAHACCDVVNRGVAVWEGKVFIGTIDGRLIALDAATGNVIWDVVTVDQDKPYTITGAPRVVRGKVYIGNSGAELGVRGYISAYDANSGELAWRFYTVPGNPADGPDGAASDAAFAEFAGKSWNGKYWEMGGGGTVWDSIVYDPEFDQLLVGVGNGAPWNHRARSAGKGDNLFLSSILALDPDTGAYKWHYQVNPAESWDFTATQQITLADLEIGGETRKVLMQAPKNGFFYVIDRSNGKLISAEPYAPQNWAERIDLATGRPVEKPGIRYEDEPFVIYPSGIGAHAWHPMSYSPDTGLVYIPAMQVPLSLADDTDYERHIGRWNTGVSFLAPPEGAVPGTTPLERRAALATMNKGMLVAWDPVKQEKRWQIDMPWPWNGGTLATAGNLLFQGDPYGVFRARAADTGEELWSFDSQRGIMAGPVSFRANGEQYIAVLAGYGGSMGMATDTQWMRRPPPNGVLLAFKIGGTGKLARLPPVEPRPFVASDESFTPAQIAEGAQQFVTFCTICHNGPVNPDLLRSPIAARADSWKAVVQDGALADNGMISFSPWLSPDQIEAVRAYVLTEAKRQAEANGQEN
ncbi:PQQ-dependent dehydrogenase (methanol/ethanol family) [Altererythrobacter atlanticus]|uniref:Quinohemoprotein alcohol dehydrogenase ADH IIB n=1 Tax=Croceibacterium atlanticum TaxID=1267766 RepID=A0A0F7KTR5_9SPHN|nr:PQQ-dependent dehydrogenase, methanol/ethanol family [Croceibacterium atlanticum]AKH42190.1 Quinohemoprotein alcohol dehydrogenase ADH IIB precursor [Croceibacterium atlanticum]MBB5733998.1 PQQ-dependent dehydrogenase (methanol/ethanol family) [Croceibacterium atlanticum]